MCFSQSTGVKRISHVILASKFVEFFEGAVEAQIDVYFWKRSFVQTTIKHRFGIAVNGGEPWRLNIQIITRLILAKSA